MIPSASVAAHVHHSAGLFGQGAAALLLALLAYFAFDELREYLGARSHASQGAEGNQARVIDLDVDGMTCQGCVRRLHRALSEDARVEDASVTLDPQHVRVLGSVNREEVVQLVTQTGFRVKSESAA